MVPMERFMTRHSAHAHINWTKIIVQIIKAVTIIAAAWIAHG